MRVPGYPAFLAAIFTFAGKSEHAVMLRAGVRGLGDVRPGGADRRAPGPASSRRRVALAALWLAALCPFTANYTAVVLTETFVVFLTALALLVLLEAYRESTALNPTDGERSRAVSRFGFSAESSSGFGTLVRPETPLLLIAVGLVLLTRWWRRADWGKLLRAALLMGSGFFFR